MRGYLSFYLQQVPGKLVVLPLFCFCILQPITLTAQGNCAIEQHVVDSWTATVQADQDAIQKQSQGSRGLKLDDSESLNERLQSDTKRLEQAKARLTDCQKKAANNTSLSPAKPQPGATGSHPVSLSNSGGARWKIDELGTLTLAQPDSRSSTVTGILLVQTDRLEGIPENTKLTMKGSLEADGSGFDIEGTAPLSAGSYLALKKKEDFSYGYTLSIKAQFGDPKTRNGLKGTASLVKSEQYRGDKGTTIKTIAIDIQQCGIISLIASSDKALNSPQTFAGGLHYPFNPSVSSTEGGPGVHLAVFLNDVAKEETVDLIEDFSVLVKANFNCTPKSRGEWRVTPGTANISVSQSDPDAVELRHLEKGGLYKVTYDLHDGSIPSEANIVLPLAGAEVERIMLHDIAAATRFARDFEKNNNLFEQVTIFTGLRQISVAGWAWEAVNLVLMGGWESGYYRGRPDSSLNRTVWLYNQVSDRAQGILKRKPKGLGAVATWYGVPVRIDKLSNFIGAYTVEKLEVPQWMQELAAKQVGTNDDAAAKASSKAGVDLADGRIKFSDLKAILLKVRTGTQDNQKTVKLWPNPSPTDNFQEPKHFTDTDREFTHPGFLPPRE